MQTIYYNPKTGQMVVDLSARKGPEKIKEEFGEGFVEVKVIDELKQTVKVVKNKLKVLPIYDIQTIRSI